MSYADKVNEDARLILLKELARQVDGRSNEVVLQRVLDAFGITRSREFVVTQLRRLEELGAVRLEHLGTVVIAQLRQEGRNHVERRSVIEGVSRPSEAD